MDVNSRERIVFFDGVCGLCNSFVNRLMRWDRKHTFYFAALQGNTARSHGLGSGESDPESIVYFSQGKVYTESGAAIRIVADLGGLYGLLRIFLIVPSFIRNGIYRWVARNRYRWFGRKELCRLPTKEERAFFLD